MILIALGALGDGGGARAQAAYYDPDAVVTVQGRVIAVQSGSAGPGAEPDLYLQVQTDRFVIDVLLGPAMWVARHGHGFGVGDRVTVTGAQTSVAGRPGIIAAELRGRGGRRTTFRDRRGAPRWGDEHGRHEHERQ
jgi:hypothetical protein